MPTLQNRSSDKRASGTVSRIAVSTSPHWQPSDTQAEDAPAPPSQSHRNVLVPSPRCAGDVVQAPELANLHPRRTVRCSHSRQGPHTQHSKSPDPALTNFLHRLMLDPPSPTSQGLALTFKCAFLPRGKCSEPSLAWSQVHFTTTACLVVLHVQVPRVSTFGSYQRQETKTKSQCPGSSTVSDAVLRVPS